MLLLDDGTVVYSASDLTVASSCEFGLLRRLDAKLGRIAPLELPEDAMRERAARLGDRYEEQVLTEMRARYGPWDPTTGRGVAEIVRPERGRYRDRATLAATHAHTMDVLRTGADVVFQAGFFDGRFSGWADFVIRHDDDGRATRSPPRYAVHDTKLARRVKVTALLQLAAYADQLLTSGIPITDQVHLILGDRTVTAHRIDDLLPVYRERRARLQALIDEHCADVGPVAWDDERYRACGRCEVCAPEVETHRDVLLVAGMRNAQRPRLRDAGITTIDALAASADEVPGIAAGTLAGLREQARLQVAQDPGPLPEGSVAADGPPPVDAPLPEGAGISGGVHYQLFAPHVVGQLPSPDAGDIFFDFEGDPLWAENGSADWGLEYLFGLVEAPTAPGADPVFRAFWAHDRTQERQALLDFLDYVARRRAAHPAMHIYHYAAYEKTALLRLAGRHGVGEEEVDQLLREAVLVDLYAAVRACLRTGQRSYSLKRLEPLYMDVGRSGDVQTAGESVVEYAEACAVRDAGQLDEWHARLAQIADYNTYDCLSTLRLRDWLVARAAEAGVVPRGRRPEGGPAEGPGDATPRDLPEGVRRTDLPDDVVVPPERDRLAEQLFAVANGGGGPADRSADRQALAMLAAALGYHWREEKPYWWAHFDRLVSEPAEWIDRRGTMVVEQATISEQWHVPDRARAPRRVLRLVGRLEPGSSLGVGARVCLLYDQPLPACLSTSADGRRGWTDRAEIIAAEATGAGDAVRDVLIVTERLGTVDGLHDALPMAVAPGPPPRTDRIAAAIRRLAEAVHADVVHGDVVHAEAGHGDVVHAEASHPDVVHSHAQAGHLDAGPRDLTLPDHPALDLLRRRPPRTRSGTLPEVVGADYTAAIIAATIDLDGSYLAVQGPPGTGKTYTGARVVADLVARGWRVGVVAQSHAVVENMLREVARAGLPAGRIGKRPQTQPDDDAPWTWLPNDRASAGFFAAQPGGYVVGGTSWDFTNPGRLPASPLDLLVVDEAGQYALADTIAVSAAARNLLLLGDPQQLPQVTQGQHPEPVDCSALGWLVDGRDTLPGELGFFLAHTWRMHPALCAAVSRLSYEGRLTSVAAAAERSLEGVPPGVGCVFVAHQGNAVASIEEAREVVAQVRAVLARRWRDPSLAHPERAVDRPLEPDDVVVVAAYNAQVWTVRRALDDAGLERVRVGTVDRYQGQQAVVAIVSTAASSADDVPRGMEFLLNRNRVNVAVSRAQWRAVIVRSDSLTDYLPGAPDGLAELGAFLGLCTDEQPAADR